MRFSKLSALLMKVFSYFPTGAGKAEIWRIDFYSSIVSGVGVGCDWYIVILVGRGEREDNTYITTALH